MPNVEKDNARSPKPRAVWGLLVWTIAFSRVSAVIWESILPFVKGTEDKKEVDRLDSSFTKTLI